MLKSLFIDKFRLFKQLKIDGLSQVNLIVGKNNSGKSALLEAIQVLASNAAPSNLVDLVVSRQESWNRESQALEQRVSNNPLRHLFFGHEFPEINDNGFRIGEDEDDEQMIHVKVGAYQSERQEDGSIIRSPIDKVDEASDLSEVDLALIMKSENKTRRLTDLDVDFRSPRHRRRMAHWAGFDPNYPYQVVPTGNMPANKVASLWDSTSLTNLEDDVIDCLKLIDERIEGVAFVEEAGGQFVKDRRIPLIKLSGLNEPLPLKSMGDGMSQLFHIILSLVNTKDGILLVDEFENGIHWSVHPHLWKAVFRIAKRLNVQIFATTHSRDCVKGFDTAWNDYPNLGSFFRLNIDSYQHSGITSYNSETLTDALEMDVEVR